MTAPQYIPTHTLPQAARAVRSVRLIMMESGRVGTRQGELDQLTRDISGNLYDLGRLSPAVMVEPKHVRWLIARLVKLGQLIQSIPMDKTRRIRTSGIVKRTKQLLSDRYLQTRLF